MSLILSPTPSAPSPRPNEAMSQGTQLVLVVVHRHLLLSGRDHFDLDYTHQEDPHPDTMEEQWKELCDLFTSEAFMKRSEQNKKNRSKLTVNHAAGSCSFQRTRACMKNQESGKSILQSCIRRIIQTKMVFGPRKEREKFMNGWMPSSQCDLEGKTYTEIEVYSEILGKKSGYVQRIRTHS
ncbi:hypothetical protein CJ030_MR2G013591 [Morella rubra]|uniref:Uncharacterized protein n=1 Tax=Morella rubra TaxID=262757 RepID=A0A6A1WCC3_9ROSI|nr:hypothetical protein CJ030_MR2G013591 [Morella rubra]